MSLVATVMRAYPYVFHPSTLLGGGMLLLIYYEYRVGAHDRRELGHRVGAFLAAGVASSLPTLAYMFVTGSGIRETTQGNAWEVDALVAGGMIVTAVLTWLAWKRFDWGPLVPTAMVALVAVAVPYGAISAFWNVSGHVITAVIPTLYLTLVDRRFWPLLAIPAVMIPNRLYLNAHTWEQVVAAVALSGTLVVAVYWAARDDLDRPAVRPTRT